MSFRHRRITRQRFAIAAAPRVVVVGHCASGKSTLVDYLRSDGIDAVASGQEHSEIPELWRRSNADLLIYLDVDLETIQKRRGGGWPKMIFDLQEARLRSAREAADLVIDASRHRADEVFMRSRAYVAWWRHFN
jgi:hypothetical protein